eukprot:1520402-Prymnesium_polylepis.2
MNSQARSAVASLRSWITPSELWPRRSRQPRCDDIFAVRRRNCWRFLAIKALGAIPRLRILVGLRDATRTEASISLSKTEGAGRGGAHFTSLRKKST